MKTCSKCQTENLDDNKFCQQCGRVLDGTAAQSGDATILLSGTLLSRGPVQQAFTVSSLFASKERAVIGRAPDCDIHLSHPSVSRYHAMLERRPNGLWVRDLASVNGVSVGGQRIGEATRLPDGQLIGVGPFLLSLTQGVLRSIDNSRGLRLEARNVEKVVSLPDGGSRKLLDNINLVVEPGEFVSLLGPSGSGKSTLMDCLNGRRPATGGKVLANGVDFYRHFDNFRQSLGYVPQKDIVHTQLTVYKALYYTARLRLPTDTDPAELKARIESVMQTMEIGPHRDTLVGNLSGGQIKRVSLGAELIGEPALLYIDEATSGLDAGTEARMMKLFRRLADEGRSIVCITHNVENVDQGHLVLVLVRGKIVYYGPPKEAPPYFHVGRISDVYDCLSQKGPEAWEKQFAASDLFREFVVSRLAQRPEPAPSAPRPVEIRAASEVPAHAAPTQAAGLKAHWEPLAERFRALTSRYLRVHAWLAPALDQWHQFGVLTRRYVELLAGDRRGLRLLVLQAPIVALFLLAGFVGKKYQDVLPRLRDLSREERQTLVQLRDLHRLFADAPPGAEGTKDRPKVRVKVHAPGAPLELDGARWFELFQKAPLPKPAREQRKSLKELPFKIKLASVPLGLDPAQAYDLVRGLQKQGLAPEQREKLAKAKLKMPAKPLELDATQTIAWLSQFRSKDLQPNQRKALNEAKFTYSGDGGTDETITGAQMLWAFEKLKGSHVAEDILKVNSPVVPDGEWINPRFTYIMLFIVVIIVLWFGCNNAAKEIVKEEAIYGRERAVNLHILPYLASKFLVQTAITTFHALVLIGVLYGTLEFLAWYDPDHHSAPPAVYRLAYPAQLGVLVLLSMTGVALGLVLSACVSSPDRANALLPYVLIPQMILGGGIISVNTGLLSYLAMALSPVYWAYRAVRLGAHDLVPPKFPGHVPYEDGVALPCAALAAQALIMLGLTAWFLRRKDA